MDEFLRNRTFDELPRNAMAKVQKNVLRDANRHLFDKSAGAGKNAAG